MSIHKLCDTDAMRNDWHIRPTKEDRMNERKVRAIMVGRGIPAASITQTSVIRFAVKLAAETK